MRDEAMRKSRKLFWMLAVLLPMILLQGCARDNTAANAPELNGAGESAQHDEADDPLVGSGEEIVASAENPQLDLASTAVQEETADGSSASAPGSIPDNTEENTLFLQIGDETLTATLVENSSTAALKELLSQGPITIDMRDYGNFEKVGELGADLPTNDTSITTQPGDLILYQGNSFVIYYAPNSWSFTRLGKINGVTADELKAILGSGAVSVTLSVS